MSTYGIGVYGVATYGGPEGTGLVDFDVTPFVARPSAYSAVSVTWSSPAGSWSQLRLLRNRYGYAVHQDDGDILVDTTGAADNYLDTAVIPGDWHYYTLYLLISGTWTRVGTTSTLMTKNYDYANRLFSSLPLYYQMIPGDLISDYSQPNLLLYGYIQSLAITLDYVKTYYDLLRYVNDPMRNNIGDLVNLAGQFGIEFEAATPARLFRQRVANAGYLGRQKGTFEGIRNLVNLTTGWDVQIDLGPNLMLNEDQSTFYHPVYAAWDATVSYPTAARISYQGFIYQAKTGGAYGAAQHPSGSGTDNTWWTVELGLVDTTQNLLGWEVISFTGGITPTVPQASIGIGYRSEVSPTVDSSNALVISNTNNTAATATLGARSVAALGVNPIDPLKPITTGVPLPNINEAWDSTRQYFTGDTAFYHGRPVRALTDSLNVAPNQDASSNGTWEPLGYDDRPYLMASLYAQGIAASYVNGYPFVEYYDSLGVLLATVYSDALPAFQVFDSFTANWGTIAGRVTDVGGLVWAASIGTWAAGPSDGGVAYPTGSGQRVATVTRPATADGTVSVTFDNDPAPGTDQGLALRYKSDHTHLFAGRTSLYSVAAGGTKTLIAAYSSSFVKGDRMTAVLSGSSIIIKKNGVTVLTTTSSFNQIESIHGLAVQ